MVRFPLTVSLSLISVKHEAASRVTVSASRPTAGDRLSAEYRDHVTDGVATVARSDN
jgi:hypothetical protein